VMGTMNFVVMPFSIGSIRFIGEVFDRTGSYDAAFVAFMATAFVSAWLIVSVRSPVRAGEGARQPARRATFSRREKQTKAPLPSGEGLG
jgi:hypothetical protein